MRQPCLVLKLLARHSILVRRMCDRAATSARFDCTPEMVCKRIRKHCETDSGAIKPNEKVTVFLNAERDENEVFESACTVLDRLIDVQYDEAGERKKRTKKDRLA